MKYKINTMTVKPVAEITGDEEPKAAFYLPTDEELNKIVDIAKKVSKKEVPFVIDIGCGNGVLAYMLAQKGLKVIAVDPHEELINQASKAYLHHYLTFEVGDAKSTLKKYRYKPDVVINSWMPSEVNLSPEIKKMNAAAIVYIKYKDDEIMTGKQYGLLQSYRPGFSYSRAFESKNSDDSITEVQIRRNIMLHAKLQ